MKSSGGRAEQAVREIALAYPETREDSPWGHPVLKVRNKSFVFMGTSKGRFHLSVKLPDTHGAALMLPFANPTGYGLGPSGWVTFHFGADEDLPLPMVRAWIDESYRAVAPKKLVATLDDGAGAPAAGSGRKAASATPAAKASRASAAPRRKATTPGPSAPRKRTTAARSRAGKVAASPAASRRGRTDG